jgi:signal transduction histidine kinase
MVLKYQDGQYLITAESLKYRQVIRENMDKEKILIIDDDIEIVKLCKSVLAEEKYIIECAATGKQALDMLSQNKYDLALLDWRLPDIDDMEILKTVKQNEIRTAIIVMSAYGDDELTKKAIQLGAYDFVDKPFSPKELKILVVHCLEKKKLMGRVDELGDISNSYKDKLIQSEKMAAMAKGINYIAHEIRKPLANIKSFSQFCLDSENIPLEKIKDRLKRILNNSNKASNIIEDTLAFSKPIKLNLSKGSANETLDKVYKNFEQEASSNEIKIIMKLSPQLPLIKFDLNHIERAFNNIVQNSLRAMSCGGTLTIETCADRKNIVIKFIDTGAGIPEDEIDKIFAPFFTKSEGGIGLGLSLTKDIVKLHGGNVMAMSEQGKGTTIIIELPIKG